MQTRTISAADLINQISTLLEFAETHLESNILYDHDDIDITETFRNKLATATELLNVSQKSEGHFREFQIFSNQLSLLVIATIRYPTDDSSNFIFKMRNLTDLLRVYSSSYAPNLPKKAASGKFFSSSADNTLKLDKEIKPIREESFRHA